MLIFNISTITNLSYHRNRRTIIYMIRLPLRDANKSKKLERELQYHLLSVLCSSDAGGADSMESRVDTMEASESEGLLDNCLYI